MTTRFPCRATIACVLVPAVLAALAAAQPPAPQGEPQTIALEVLVPADAVVQIDDYRTQSVGVQRVYLTPPLAAGRDYRYTLKATVGDRTVTREISVRAGA